GSGCPARPAARRRIGADLGRHVRRETVWLHQARRDELEQISEPFPSFAFVHDGVVNDDWRYRDTCPRGHLEVGERDRSRPRFVEMQHGRLDQWPLRLELADTRRAKDHWRAV